MSEVAEFFIAGDPLVTAQELQRTIGEAHPEAQETIAQQALDVLGDVKELNGTNRIAMHTLSAFVINRGLTIDEQVYGRIQFGELGVKAWFGGFKYIQARPLSSLCLDLFDVTVLWPVEPDDLEEGRMTMPLLVPVFAVDRVWALS